MLRPENSTPSVGLAGKRQSARKPRTSGRRAKKQGGAGVNNRKVLLFGRQRELALYRAEVLHQNGYHVLTPTTRGEAVAAIEGGGLGAVILSYTLSSETVEEMAELLKQKSPGCPLIAISQTGTVDRRIAPDEVVIADDGPTALLAALRRALRRRVQ